MSVSWLQVRDANHEEAAPPEQIRGASADEEQAAEGERVGAHDPLEVPLRQAEVGFPQSRLTPEGGGRPQFYRWLVFMTNTVQTAMLGFGRRVRPRASRLAP